MKINNNISFKGIEHHIIKKANFAKFEKQILKTVPKETGVLIEDSPLLSTLTEAINKAGEKFPWIEQHLALKGFKLNLPKSFRSENADVFFLHGDEMEKCIKALAGKTKIEKIIRVVPKAIKAIIEASQVTKDKDARNFLIDYIIYSDYKNKFIKFAQKHNPKIPNLN